MGEKYGRDGQERREERRMSDLNDFISGYNLAKEELEERLKEAEEVIKHYKEICGCGYGCHCKTAREYLDKWK